MSGETEKKILFLSAADRINYGDLLFPIIFKRNLEKFDKYTFTNYGLIDSDLSYFGAMRTKSFKKLQRDITKINEPILIIGGGEVFFARWTKLYGFINFWYSKALTYQPFNKLEKKFNVAQRLLSNGRIKHPFSPSIKELNNPKTKIIFNAVGGRFRGSKNSEKNKNLIEALNDATYISVRDGRSQDSLRKYGVKSECFPDSAIVMSDIFKNNTLKNLKSIKNFEGDNYFFLQVGINKAPDDLENFCSILNDFAARTNVKFVLCPIGMAPNHEDEKILLHIHKLLSNSEYILPKNIYDIMYLISNSNGYLGTSLHGMITAQSFSVPFFPLNPSIKKLHEYCKFWVGSICDGCIDYDNLNVINELYKNWNYEKAKELLENQKSLAYKNFNNIIDRIQN